MEDVLTAAQMRAIEQAAIASGKVTGLELMERAGKAVVEAIFEEWPELETSERGASPSRTPGYLKQEEKRRAVVLCGPGNNGGDGFVVARLLKERGWEVEVFLYGDPAKLPPDARVNYEKWGAAVSDAEEYQARRKWDCDVLVDALFGTGLKRCVGELGELFWNMKDMCQCFDIQFGHDRGRPAIVAVDIASGVCADSGRVFQTGNDHFESASTAHLTVSFHRLKPGHLVANGPEHCGKTTVKDIGLSPFILPEILPPEAPQTAKLADVSRSIHRLGKHTGHKYTHGHALILSGGSGRTGAARLAARGALRIGAGLVTLGVPGAAQMEVATRVTALMLRRVDDAAALTEALADHRLNALCLGPGLGLSDEKAGLVEAALKSGRACVLDADALTILAQNPALRALLHENCVLTPHEGEFARLFPDIAKRLREEPMSGPAYSKVDAARDAAKSAGCTVLFKGPDTVIADPPGHCSINSAHYERAAPWLATAGSGDVLAGFITGLLARGFAPMAAADTAAYLHVECALSFGAGLIAEDLPEELPKVFRKLGL